MNEFTYVPDYRDWDNWSHNMFRIADPPPRLPSWQDYFETDDPNSFSAFLHYYEPELTRFSKELVRRYGLYDQLADVKMVCVWNICFGCEKSTIPRRARISWIASS
jgi:hypothetical protein